MVIEKFIEEAEKTGGIVIKTSRYAFKVVSSFWSFAVEVALQRRSDVCYYEIVSNPQCTYVDLDLKRKDWMFLPPKLELNP